MVASGAVALVLSFEKGLAVYDLHDSHKGAVVVGEGNHRTALVPGRTAILTDTCISAFEDVNQAQLVGYRRLSSHSFDGATKVFQADFEIMSVVRGLKPLAAMVASDRASSRKASANLLKTAAILMQLAQSREAYRTYVAAEKMACNLQPNK